MDFRIDFNFTVDSGESFDIFHNQQRRQLAQNILLEHLHPSVLSTLKQDLQNQIDALEIAGVAVSNEFGTDTHIGISQKTLTDAFNKIWDKFEDITGDVTVSSE